MHDAAEVAFGGVIRLRLNSAYCLNVMRPSTPVFTVPTLRI